jgi:hypothetical protein
MSTLVFLPSIAAVAISALAQCFTDPRITKKFAAKSMVALAVYAVHAVAGMAVIYYLLPHKPEAALGVTLAFVGWMGLSVLVLVRIAPRLKEPPALLMRAGVLDAVFLLIIVAGIVQALGSAS